MPDPAIAITFTGNDADAARMFARQQKQIDGLTGSLRGIKAAGEEAKSGFHIGAGVIGEVAGLAAGYLSVGKALEWAGAAAETWRAILRETTATTREAVEASLSYAALQTGRGTNIKAPVMAVMRMAQEFGIKDQGPVMALAGGLQAAMGGDVKGAERETLEMLKLHQVTNQPFEELLDVGQLAAVKGMDPGQFAREIAAAARERKLEPSMITRGARSMGAFASPEEWIATQAALATQLGARGATAVGELPGLFGEGAPKDFAAFLKKQGIGKRVPMMEALGMLRPLFLRSPSGFLSVEALDRSGLDVKQRELIAMAAEAQPGIMDLAGRLPGLGIEAELQKRHEQIVGQFPEEQEAEFAAKMEARHAYRVAFDPEAAERRIEDRELQMRGEALERSGNRTILGIGQTDLTGREIYEGKWWSPAAHPLVTGSRILADMFQPERSRAVDAALAKIRVEQDQGAGVGDIIKPLDTWTEIGRTILEGGKMMIKAASDLRGGSAMVPAGEDR